MSRECKKCVYHTSGKCSQWECKGTVTIEDVRADALSELKTIMEKQLNDLQGLSPAMRCCFEIWMSNVLEQLKERKND